MQANYYRLALLLVIASAVANSANGLIVRSMDAAGGWQIVFYRSCFLAGALCIVFVVQSGGRVRSALRELRPWALLGSLAVATVNTCFISLHDLHHGGEHHVRPERSPALRCAARLDRAGETVERGVWRRWAWPSPGSW